MKRYVLTEAASDKRLPVRGGALVAEPDEGRRDRATEWIMPTTGDGAWTLVNAATGRPPDASGQSTADGAPVGAWPPNSGSDQRRRITPVTAG
ncbi:RICIN domain-containing protein [Streptomyces djakartensis]|uniref:RICIN domain-containing protein n=1 Tax=Streptomyces djakartensis TaxID=68193 RepID=UPI003F7F5498